MSTQGDSLAHDLFEMMGSATSGWKRLKKQTGKTERVRCSQIQNLYSHSDRTTIREAAFEVMEQAYMMASANGRYYANSRQVYYAARGPILKRCNLTCLNSQYFSQVLLKDYLEEFEPEWKVVWDARGHLQEPHTNIQIGVGGANIITYMGRWTGSKVAAHKTPSIPIKVPTIGPCNRFRTVLFIEKEGFNEILLDAKLDKKYDLAIISTKGLPVKACCDLLYHLEDECTIFAIHDFDKSGFKILKTLRKGVRLAKGVKVVDLGFRLADIEGLDPEPCSDEIGRDYLRSCGATDAEIDFLQKDQRVELNAMMSSQFIAWIEKKLKEHKVKKVIPDSKVLETAFQRACFGIEAKKKMKELWAETMKKVDASKNLERRVQAYLRKRPEISWDEAIWMIAHKKTKREIEKEEKNEEKS